MNVKDDAQGDPRFREPPPRHDEPELELDLAASERPAQRCPHCLEEVDRDGYRCNGCRARFHLGCLGEARGRTRGCSLCGGAVVPERRMARARFAAAERERRIATRARLASGLGFLVGLPLWCVASGVTAQTLGAGDSDLVMLVAVVLVPLVLSSVTAASCTAFVRWLHEPRDDEPA